MPVSRMMKLVAIIVAALSVAAMCFAAGAKIGAHFVDVPDTHWAASSVRQLADQGIMNGYPDSTFKGDKTVTRYELAVVLARFAEVIEEGRNTLHSAEELPKEVSLPTNCPPWTKDSIAMLVANGFFPIDSPIIADGNAAVTGTDLAQALSAVGARVVDIDTPEGARSDR